MKNSKAKRIIAVLLCLAVLAGSELSGMTNIVGDLFATETPVTDTEGITPVTQEEEVRIVKEDADESETTTPASDETPEEDGTPEENTPETEEQGEEESGTQEEEAPGQSDSKENQEQQSPEVPAPDTSKEDDAPAGTPGNSAYTPSETPADQTDQSPADKTDQSPADDAKQDGDQIPADTPQEDAKPDEIPPLAPGEEQPVIQEEPEEELPEKEEEDWEFADDADLEVFESLGDDEVGEIMLRDEAATFGAPRRARTANTRTWNFDLHYVNQDDGHSVSKEDSFSLKYQIEFKNNGSESIPAGAVEIRIPRKLLEKRGSESAGYITEDQVAVPVETDEQNQKYGSTSFLYRVEGDDLVFFNGKPVPAGTNSMWQVLYKVDSMDVIEDGEKNQWTLTPSVSVTNGEDEDKLSEADCEGLALTGTIDPYVRIDSFTKSLYKETNRRYTPGLYSESQVKSYIDGDLPAQFSGDNFGEYRYVVWEMAVKGTATQPWQLKVNELPVIGNTSTKGFVVGYKDRHNDSLGYNVPVTSPSWNDSNNLENGFLKAGQTLTAESRERSFGSRFWVVTAYPIDQVSVGTALRNQASVTMDPIDEDADADTSQPQVKEWIYEDYKWDYKGDTIYIRKNYNVSDSEKVYSGWLDVYRRASQNGQDYGEFPFTTSTSFYGYKWTHDAGENGKLGERKEGNTFKLVATDDTMYARLGQGEGNTWLGPQDYYFTEITVTATDRNIDVFEDKEVPGEPGQLKVYVMNGRKDGGILTNTEGQNATVSDWEEIYTETLDPAVSTTLQKTFRLNDTEMAGEPWRVKAEYVSGNYVTTCRIDVKVRLRYGSPKLASVCRLNSTVSSVKLEDISGVYGEYWKEKDGNQTLVSTIYVSDENGSKGDITPTTPGTSVGTGDSTPDSVKVDSNSALLNYSGYGGYADLTRKLYGGLLCRDNDNKELTNLTPKAEATKASTSTNDSENERVLVDYQLTAYNGWQVYGQDAIPWLSADTQAGNLLNPGHKDVVFYDLLPYGMKYDPTVPATAGRITNLDGKGNYKTRPDFWIPSQVRVDVNPDTDVVANYRGTGRTLVVFHISYEGDDPSVYTNGMWMEGWGVSFRAYYQKKDLTVAQAGTNICAFMAEDGSELIGAEGEVFPDDGNSYPGSFTDADKALGQIRDDSDQNICNVMYAGNQATGEFVEASQTEFLKKVKADEDQYGVFKDSAKVVPGKGYTYEIAVAQTRESSGSLTDIVVYDALDQADGTQLQGTFRNVAVSGLAELDIDAKVYYSWKTGATQPTTPQELAAENSDWIRADLWETTITSEAWKEAHPDEAEPAVRAVAVDLSQKTDKKPFVLQEGQNVTFQIAMTLPAGAKEGDVVKNQASYYAKPTNAAEETAPAKFGSSITTVTVAPARKVEVIKEFAEGRNIPASAANTPFRFRLYEITQNEKGETVNRSLANQAYTLQDTEGNVLEGNLPHATDADGGFTLRAGQKAVFLYADIYTEDTDGSKRLNIYAEEVEEIFWQSHRTIVDNSAEQDAEGKYIGSRKITITNDYRPVLYVQKQLQGILNDETHRAEADSQEFTFRIETSADGGETWTPLAEKNYYYVDRAGLNGGVPGPDKNHGQTLAQCKGTTDSEGRFRIKKGDVAALCFDQVGVMYRVSEVTSETITVDGKPLAADKEGNDLPWICQTAPQTGVTSVFGTRATITNAYRWKDLYLTKKITHQEEKDYKDTTFTFQLKRQNADGTFDALSSEERARITWQLTDAPEGSEVQHLDNNGQITVACGGRTIRLSGLEAGAVYQTEEILPENSDYAPDQNPVTVTMPVSGDRRNLTVTNDWLWRPLYVTKTVAYDPSDQETAQKVKTAEFRMVASVGQTKSAEVLLTSIPATRGAKEVTYDLMEQGRVIQTGLRTEEGGVFTLKDGQTAVFKDAAKAGWHYSVQELHPDDPEELAKEQFQQVYPANNAPATGTFEGERGEAGIINGSNDSLYITKDYVCDPGDAAAEKYVESSMPTGGTETGGEENKELLKGRLAVKVKLTLNGTPLELCEVTVIGPDGTIYKDQWTAPGAEDSLEQGIYLLEPGTTVIIPPAILNQYRTEGQPELSYELTELDRRRVDLYQYEITSEGEGGTPVPAGEKLIEINQKLPGNDGSVVGTVERNPVASITNEVKSHAVQSQAGKEMTWNSTEVPEGAKLVWRVEKKAGGHWLPAADVSYVVFGCYAEDEAGSRTLMPDVSADGPFEGTLRKTGSDGKIEMYKAPGLKPRVYFADQTVWLNLNGEGQDGDYRLVEVMEDSDPAWGMLVGYAEMATEMVEYTKDNTLAQSDPEKHNAGSPSETGAEARAASRAAKAPRVNRAGDDAAGLAPNDKMRAPCNLAAGEQREPAAGRVKRDTFYNSNVPKAVEIAKEMDGDSDRLFTMVLKQVLLLADDADQTYASRLNSVSPDDILMSEGRSGIPYTVYVIGDEPTPENVIRERETGSGGTLTLYAGEYARFHLPEGTLWTLTEDQPATFETPRLRTEPEGATDNRLYIAGENLMFLYQTAAVQPVTPELKVTVTNPDVYLDDFRHVSTQGSSTLTQYRLNLMNHISISFDDSPLTTRDVKITGQYVGFEGLETLASSREEVEMHYTVTYTVPGTGSVLTKDFTLTYHPSLPTGLKVEVLKPYIVKADIKEAGSGWNKLYSLDLFGEYIKVYAVYSDGRKEELNEEDLELSGQYTESKALEILKGSSTSTKMSYAVTYQGSTQDFSLQYAPGIALTWYMVNAYKESDDTNKIYDLFGNSLDLNVLDNKVLEIPEFIKKDPNSDAVYQLTSIESTAFYRKGSILEEITIPGNIETLDGPAFQNSHFLRKVKLEKGVKTLRSITFIGCERLETIELPDTLETIGERVFANCDSLETVEIPASVKYVMDNAFLRCGNLKQIYVNQKKGFVYYTNSDKKTISSPPWGASSNPKISYLDGNGGWTDN